jgi:hypothetical protein
MPVNQPMTRGQHRARSWCLPLIQVRRDARAGVARGYKRGLRKPGNDHRRPATHSGEIVALFTRMTRWARAILGIPAVRHRNLSPPFLWGDVW